MNISVVIHYLIAINLLTFFVYGHDKWKAQNPDPTAPPRRIKKKKKKKRRSRKVKHARRRTPEATLLLLAALGGSVGALLAMHIFRHKTHIFERTIKCCACACRERSSCRSRKYRTRCVRLSGCYIGSNSSHALCLLSNKSQTRSDSGNALFACPYGYS